MTENVKNVFKMLGVEPNEMFKIEGNETPSYFIDKNLRGYEVYHNITDFAEDLVIGILNGSYEIIKLPKA